nr:hypothetical protein [uncultured Treponema sp.]
MQNIVHVCMNAAYPCGKDWRGRPAASRYLEAGRFRSAAEEWSGSGTPQSLVFALR